MKKLPLLVAGAALGALLAGSALFGSAGSSPPPTAQGVVMIAVRPAPVSPAAAAAPVATGAAPAQVEARVRRAYSLLRDVAFRCDARGCAVTATIPPPTDEAFLATRQELLLGGLAREAAATGYAATGPVQMEEISENLFHIRLAVTPAPPRG
ncbi:hypothetical protein [uncultured Sphingomonas sp.]|uniref:hypothetical protein n=1 Tax=uncultured Sphingomonas sp. TaxID=158754 RepID=UPI0025FB7091|nr:hypothetical protein [uncultured Sphingomonas sp.]